jgi:leucyl aminopeptidase (aminopeptidase T)
MNIQDNDRVLITTDQNTLLIGEALAQESKNMGAVVKLIKLEDFGSRPLTTAPDSLVDLNVDFAPTASFFAAESQEGEIKMRIDLGRKIREKLEEIDLPSRRHGHMPNVTPQLIQEGMTADYIEVNRLTMDIFDLVKDAQSIHVTSSKGSDIIAKFNPVYKWIPCHGLYHQPGDWGNLPEGEVFTCPETVDGLLVVDVLGDYFSPKYGVLDTPVSLEIEDGLVMNIDSKNVDLAKELWDYLRSSDNGHRAGEFAIGTNTAIKKLTGRLLQDEKIPGIHVAFGNPYPNDTGATWTSDVHVDVIPTNCTISVDGEILMKDGVFQI